MRVYLLFETWNKTLENVAAELKVKVIYIQIRSVTKKGMFYQSNVKRNTGS